METLPPLSVTPSSVSGTKAVDALATSVARSQAVLFYGQRLAILGGVTTVVANLIAEEEGERKSLLAAYQIASSSVVPFDPRRVSQNKITCDESENRSEIISEEFAAHMRLLVQFVAESKEAFRSHIKMREVERILLERQATNEFLKVSVAWSVKFNQIVTMHGLLMKNIVQISLQRRIIEQQEQDARVAFARNEDVKFRRISYMGRSEKQDLAPVQRSYEEQLELEHQRRLKDENERLNIEAKLAAEAARKKQRDEVIAEEEKNRSRGRLDEQSRFDDVLRLFNFQRATLL